MKQINQSASKIVFIIVAITMCIAFLAVIFANLTNEPISSAVVAIAAASISSAFTYYFTKKDKDEKENPVS